MVYFYLLRIFKGFSYKLLAGVDGLLDLLVVIGVHDDVLVVTLLGLEVVLLVSDVVYSHHRALLLTDLVIPLEVGLLEGNYSTTNRSIFFD
jgi:hypothetical protein